LSGLVQDIWTKQTNLKTDFKPNFVLNLVWADEGLNEGLLVQKQLKCGVPLGLN